MLPQLTCPINPFVIEGRPLVAWHNSKQELCCITGEGEGFNFQTKQSVVINAFGVGEALLDSCGLWLRDIQGHWHRYTRELVFVGKVTLKNAVAPVGVGDNWWFVYKHEVWRWSLAEGLLKEVGSEDCESLCLCGERIVAVTSFGWKWRDELGRWQTLQIMPLPVRQIAWLPSTQSIFFTSPDGQIGFFEPFAHQPQAMLAGARAPHVRILGANGYDRIGLVIGTQFSFLKTIPNEKEAFIPLALAPFDELPISYAAHLDQPLFGWITKEGQGEVCDLDNQNVLLTWKTTADVCGLFFDDSILIECHESGEIFVRIFRKQ